MKKIFLLLLLAGMVTMNHAQVKTTIAQARAMATGTVVTVSGIVTNGSELGVIRYMQDATAGIAAYPGTGSVPFGSVLRGDSITVTGTLKSYNQLLELDPITSFTVHTSGNPSPLPQVITPSQVSESYEAELIQMNNVEFSNAGTPFAGNTNYNFTTNGQAGVVRINNASNLVGTIIPGGEVTLLALVSQFHYTNPASGYQLLARDVNDIILGSAIAFTSALSQTNMTQTAFDLAWTTNEAGTTELFYGRTPALELGHLPSTGTGTTHAISISGVNAGDLIFVNAFSVMGTDTAFSGIRPFVTISASSGNIKVYFNTPVNHDYSTGTDAIYLNQLVDDTLCNYINRAKYTLDMCFYNINLQIFTNVLTALNNAANRGVQIRFISDGSSNNAGIENLVASIKKIQSPQGADYTIMHNKFMIVDVNSTNPNDPILWTGSTNLTDDNVNHDANNVIIFQDQSMAKIYKLEFEEMWGSTTMTANMTASHFGKFKQDNTPHAAIVGGNHIDIFFSPSDNVNAQILSTIQTASSDLSIASMVITRAELANAIIDRSNAGVATNILVNSFGECGSVPGMLTPVLGTHFVEDNVAFGIMHCKYMVVDQSNPSSDALVFTGSHNWSAAANTSNDENSVVVHNASIANQYYQHFAYRFVENNGVFGSLTDPPVAVNDVAVTQKDIPVVIDILANDTIHGAVNITIINTGSSGFADINFANVNTIVYTPNVDFVGFDTISYSIFYAAVPELGDTAIAIIQVVNVPPVAHNDTASTNKNTAVTVSVLQNDTFTEAIVLSIVSGGDHGSSELVNLSTKIKYTPATDYVGYDTIFYAIHYVSDITLADTATLIIRVKSGDGVPEMNTLQAVIYPNPSYNGMLSILAAEPVQKVSFYNLSGKCVMEINNSVSNEMLNLKLPSGVFMVRMISYSGKTWTEKVVIK